MTWPLKKQRVCRWIAEWKTGNQRMKRIRAKDIPFGRQWKTVETTWEGFESILYELRASPRWHPVRSGDFSSEVAGRTDAVSFYQQYQWAWKQNLSQIPQVRVKDSWHLDFSLNRILSNLQKLLACRTVS